MLSLKTTFRKTKDKILITLICLNVFKVSLDICYASAISQAFAYEGFELQLNVVKLIETYIMFIIVSYLLSIAKKKLSSITLSLLILLSYAPTLTIYAFKDLSRMFMYAVTLFWISVILLLLYTPRIELPTLKLSKYNYALIIICFTAITLLMSTRLKASLNFDLTKVYEIRSEYVEAKIPFSGYFFNWQGYIINPIILSISLIKKKWFYLVPILFFQFYLFSITGLKAFLFLIPIVLLMIRLITKGNYLSLLAILLASFIMLTIILYRYLNEVFVMSFLVRRTFFVPGLLYFYYYDFFSKNGPILLSSSRIFRNFIDYPYDLSPPHLIGDIYFNRTEMGANTGIIGDAYMNFGFMGFIVWGILLVMILKFVDACLRGKDIRIGIAGIVSPVVTLTNSGLLTVLLTHGLLILLLSLYLLPRKL